MNFNKCVVFCCFLLKLVSSINNLKIPTNNIYFKLLDFKNFTYYIDILEIESEDKDDHSPNPCEIIQPQYNFNTFDQTFDHTSKSQFINQDYSLGVDDQLFVMSKSGYLQLYNMTFDDKSVKFDHINEINMNDIDLQMALNIKERYVGIHYSFKYKSLFIVFNLRTIIVNVDYDISKRELWFSSKTFEFKTNPNSQISYSKLFNEKIFIIRDFQIFEIYDILQNQTLKNIFTLNFNTFFIADLLGDLMGNLQKNFSDFEINNEFLCFILKNQNLIFIIPYQGDYDKIVTETMFPIHFDSKLEFNRLEMIDNKIFLLCSDVLSKGYILKEYVIKNNQAIEGPTRKFGFDLLDFYVTKSYILASFNTYVNIIPHSYLFPLNANEVLTRTFNEKDLNLISKFESKSLYQNYFTLSKKNFLDIAKVTVNQAILKCDSSKISNSSNLVITLKAYNLNCSKLDDSCDLKNYNIEYTKFSIEIEKNDLKSDVAMLVIIVSIAGSIVILGLIFSCVWYLKLRRKFKILSKEFVSIRTTSKEDIELKTESPNKSNRNEQI